MLTNLKLQNIEKLCYYFLKHHLTNNNSFPQNFNKGQNQYLLISFPFFEPNPRLRLSQGPYLPLGILLLFGGWVHSWHQKLHSKIGSSSCKGQSCQQGEYLPACELPPLHAATLEQLQHHELHNSCHASPASTKTSYGASSSLRGNAGIKTWRAVSTPV